jgi:hypothetical protein
LEVDDQDHRASRDSRTNIRNSHTATEQLAIDPFESHSPTFSLHKSPHISPLELSQAAKVNMGDLEVVDSRSVRR